MSLATIVARNLHQQRLRRHFTQGDLAAKARVTVSYVSMLERGLRSPPLETLERFANALMVAPVTLLKR